MINIEKNKDLTSLTTFKIGSLAEYFVVVKNKEEFLEALAWAKERDLPIFILGGGSNILITKEVKGLVIKNEIKGMEIISESEDGVLLKSLSGETWSKFVSFSVSHNFYGLENMFLIYGTVGAAPIQNTGAYGVELRDVFYELEAINLASGQLEVFDKEACRFAYRDSIFKNELAGKYFIYSLTVKLSLEAELKLEYGTIKEELTKKGIANPSQNDLVQTIAEIRNSKLPNPAELPNAGSFFKNVELSVEELDKLKLSYPDMPSFPSGEGKAKIPTAWLIEKAGYKGKKVGPVSMSEKQALILVNHDEAKASDVLSLVKELKQVIKDKFGLDIIEEVNII